MRKYVQKIKQLRKKKYFNICIAESCTGGMISAYLTSVSGSSEFFEVCQSPCRIVVTLVPASGCIPGFFALFG